ncbi:hypothetical protein ONZ45_g3472 [Pleurotus djamor]|nr:hypothetical protein ONZ45_g3472 [Pleurotus djamor]
MFPKTMILFTVIIAAVGTAIPATGSGTVVGEKNIGIAGGVDNSNGTPMPKNTKEGTSSLPDDDFEIMSGCNQGDCPDFGRPFDMLVIVDGGKEYDIRVSDCGQCLRHYAGSGNGGCFDFTGCGRPQTICVDDNNKRGHRIWRDTGDKGCFRMPNADIGFCGNAWETVITPEAEVACTW